MNTLGRILIILIAAFIVGGATYAISQTAAAQTLTGGAAAGGAAETGQMEDRPAPSALTTDQSTLSNQLGSRPEGGGEGRGGEGRGGLQTLGQNLLKIAVIVAAVQVLWSIGRRMNVATQRLTQKNRLGASSS